MTRGACSLGSGGKQGHLGHRMPPSAAACVPRVTCTSRHASEQPNAELGGRKRKCRLSNLSLSLSSSLPIYAAAIADFFPIDGTACHPSPLVFLTADASTVLNTHVCSFFPRNACSSSLRLPPPFLSFAPSSLSLPTSTLYFCRHHPRRRVAVSPCTVLPSSLLCVRPPPWLSST